MRRAGRAGAGEEERFPAPRGSTASRPGRHGTAGPAAVPGATLRRPQQPRDLDGNTVTSTQPPRLRPSP